MNDLDIARLRVYVTQPKVTPRYRYTGTCEPETLYCNVLRLTTRGGVEGVAGALSGDYYAPDAYDANPYSYADAFRPMIGALVGRDVLHREAISAEMLAARADPIPDPESLVEIAMWDAFARALGPTTWRGWMFFSPGI